ncbi:MAG TPA: hypothetical protein VFM76_00050 [Methylophaga sp.]|nr:hypothetical protein [Methylophaga sp.]
MRLYIFSGLTLLLSSSIVFAGGSKEVESVSCGISSAIEVGMTPADVKSQCGKSWEPSYISEHIRPSSNGDEDVFHKWLVHPKGLPETHVLLKNGEVVRIFTSQMAPLPTKQ